MAGVILGKTSLNVAANAVWVAMATAGTAIAVNYAVSKTSLGPGGRALAGGLAGAALGAGLMYVGAPATGLGVLAGSVTVAGVQTSIKVMDSGYLRTVENAAARQTAPAQITAPAPPAPGTGAGVGDAANNPAGAVYSMGRGQTRR